MTKDTHKSRLLAYLYQYKSITSLEAIRDLGNTRLSATIFTLRDEGYGITSESVKVYTRWGTTTNVTKYCFKTVES
tara:strand:- start:509 stop:736 length:228 start_codon:yes stop_codon:yes gene_type:complete